jgi:DNA mismatch endonuclease, patch repair protein
MVHGCFWHGHTCKHGQRKPVTNAKYWLAKIERNRSRDRLTAARLRRSGWRVLLVWECQTNNTARLAKQLARFLASQ